MIKPIATTPEIDAAIRAGAPICWCISGGQDSDTLVLEGNAELDRRGPLWPRLCLHNDLGVLAWESALPHCERLARHVGLPLIVTKRQQGDLLDRVSPALAEQRAQVCQFGNLPAHPALVLAGYALLPV